MEVRWVFGFFQRKTRTRLGNAAERSGAHINSATRRNVVGCSHGLSGVSASTRRSNFGLSSGFGRAPAASGAGGTSEAPLVAVASFSLNRVGSHDEKVEEGDAPGALAASAGSAATSRAIRTTAQGKKRRIAFPWGAEGARSRLRTTLASGGRDTRAS